MASVFDLAQKFRDVIGVPAATIKDILDRARQLQDQLFGSGESSPGLRRSQAEALMETTTTLLALGETQSALTAAHQAQEIFRALLAQQPDSTDFQRELSVSYDKVGDVQVAQGNLPAALASYQEGLAIRDRLAKSDPGNAGWQRDLAVSYDKVGDVQVAQGNLPAALASYQAASPSLTAWRSPIPAMPTGRTICRFRTTRSATCRWRRAIWRPRWPHIRRASPFETAWRSPIPASRAGSAICRFPTRRSATCRWRRAIWRPRWPPIRRTSPSWTAWRSPIPAMPAGSATCRLSYDKVGDVQMAQGNLPAALTSYQASLAIMERLAKSDPGNADWQRDLSVSYEQVGDVQVAQGNLPAALASYQAGLAISGPPGEVRSQQRRLAARPDRCRTTRSATCRRRRAIWRLRSTSYQAGLLIAQRLAESDPGNAGLAA